MYFLSKTQWMKMIKEIDLCQLNKFKYDYLVAERWCLDAYVKAEWLRV